MSDQFRSKKTKDLPQIKDFYFIKKRNEVYFNYSLYK
jgi:hypothetical protein